jgi:hypothetical protein
MLFFIYCMVDGCCYAFGLYVIQRKGANMMMLVTAITLPVTDC